MPVPAGTALRAAGTATGTGLRRAYAHAATVVHTAWLDRRNRTPWPWVVPVAVVAAFLCR